MWVNKETPEQKARRRERDRKRQALKRAAMSPEEKRAYAAQMSEYAKKRRRKMSVEERRAQRKATYEKYKSDAYRAVSASYMRRRRRENVAAAIAERLRARVKSALRRGDAPKALSTLSLTGCSAAELRVWIERQFTDGMSWQNRSKWHVDHIIPCSAFNLKDPDQQKVAFHFSNLRPIWAADNVRKHAAVPLPQRRIFWALADVAEARKKLGLIQPCAQNRNTRQAMETHLYADGGGLVATHVSQPRREKA